MSVITHRDGGDLARTRRLGLRRFENAVRRELPRWDCQRPCGPIIRRLFAALTNTTGVLDHRRGGLERVELVLADWHDAHRRLADTESRMTDLLDELELTELVTSITGLSAIGAATILAETGDPNRFASARAVVKHSGLAPRENSSGNHHGRTRTTGQGRPRLRLAAWRAVWGALRSNPVYSARYQHLTTRAENKLSDGQAHAALAAALLRQLWVVVTTGQRWDPTIAATGRPAMPAAA